MTTLEWIGNEVHIVITDIATVAKTTGTDTVDGLTFLESILAPVAQDLKDAGLIIEVADPALAGLVIAVTQVMGLIKASAQISGGMLIVLNNPAALAADYSDLQKQYNSFKTIEAAQEKVIMAALSQIASIAIKAKSNTAQEIENAVKNL
jgi:hypothetical protein